MGSKTWISLCLALCVTVNAAAQQKSKGTILWKGARLSLPFAGKKRPLNLHVLDYLTKQQEYKVVIGESPVAGNTNDLYEFKVSVNGPEDDFRIRVALFDVRAKKEVKAIESRQDTPTQLVPELRLSLAAFFFGKEYVSTNRDLLLRESKIQEERFAKLETPVTAVEVAEAAAAEKASAEESKNSAVGTDTAGAEAASVAKATPPAEVAKEEPPAGPKEKEITPEISQVDRRLKDAKNKKPAKSPVKSAPVPNNEAPQGPVASGTASPSFEGQMLDNSKRGDPLKVQSSLGNTSTGIGFIVGTGFAITTNKVNNVISLQTQYTGLLVNAGVMWANESRLISSEALLTVTTGKSLAGENIRATAPLMITGEGRWGGLLGPVILGLRASYEKHSYYMLLERDTPGVDNRFSFFYVGGNAGVQPHIFGHSWRFEGGFNKSFTASSSKSIAANKLDISGVTFYGLVRTQVYWKIHATGRISLGTISNGKEDFGVATRTMDFGLEARF